LKLRMTWLVVDRGGVVVDKSDPAETDDGCPITRFTPDIALSRLPIYPTMPWTSTSTFVPFFLQSLPSPLAPIPTSKTVSESVGDITNRAHHRIAINFSKRVSLSTLLRSYEKTVLYQGAIYVSEGDYVQGYLYLYMFAEYEHSFRFPRGHLVM